MKLARLKFALIKVQYIKSYGYEIPSKRYN